ncbi:peptidase M49-like protein [Marinoscillum furvescens DSM 4134]|uniref:Peptidase M49-like protein n=2 Tax=Marinoscillum furvescens TaxID=1026 RepID=A0A3D9KXP0_MARFU|nr:peptidase M49-like protein [Marinoscillum furvescens DSM 4134]
MIRASIRMPFLFLNSSSNFRVQIKPNLKMKNLIKGVSLCTLGLLTYCTQPQKEQTEEAPTTNPMEAKLAAYKSVKLTTDLSQLSESEKQMIPKLIEAAKIMDELFWYEAYGQKDSLLSTLEDEATRKFTQINYGPWDRLQNNEPFIAGVGPKPAGANFYPADMTKEEFEAADLEDKKSLYTFLRRDENGDLMTVPYRTMFAEEVAAASALLLECADIAEDEGLKNYLKLRAEALLTDEYQPSDMAWMDMKSNGIDVVIGPIENYEDALYNYKAAHEAYVLVKDKSWSERLSKYAAFLPELQRGLPVAAAYKAEKPGSDADLNAYDVVYYAGDCNAGSKTIAINLPNDEEVQLAKGSRRLQLKNAMQAKFDEILVPISEILITPEQRQHITFDAFFGNTMFHEVAHGLGIKKTINGKGTVRDALKEHSSALEEGKADVLGMYMITQLHKKGEIDGDIKDYYTTFMAGIFRSVRFGAASAHGKANMIRFNFFQQLGAFQKQEDGTYAVDYNKMEEAMNALSEKILTLQGDGDYEGVDLLVKEMGLIGPELRADLLKLEAIPVDIVFEQGVEVLGLN